MFQFFQILKKKIFSQYLNFFFVNIRISNPIYPIPVHIRVGGGGGGSLALHALCELHRWT